ncbi:MAG: ABC transporter permease [Betaproteobacteria bacterium]|nr:ABC transporter permease [Betaproteobacteria bacterium]
MVKSTRLWSWLLAAVLLILWEVLSVVQGWSLLVLPPPSRIAQSLWQGLASGFLWPHLGVTLFEMLAGLALGCVLGLVGGVALGEFPRWRAVLMPYVVVSQVVPKLALVPLLIMWLGFDWWPTVVVTALICFFPLLENTVTALQHVDAQQVDLFRLLRASRWQTLWRLKLPAGLPSILAGFRVAVVLSLVGAVVGEFIGASQGLGALIIAAQGSMDTPLMFAVLVLITLMGWGLYQLGVQCETWLLRRLSLPVRATSLDVSP